MADDIVQLILRCLRNPKKKKMIKNYFVRKTLIFNILIEVLSDNQIYTLAKLYVIL